MPQIPLRSYVPWSTLSFPSLQIIVSSSDSCPPKTRVAQPVALTIGDDGQSSAMDRPTPSPKCSKPEHEPVSFA